MAGWPFSSVSPTGTNPLRVSTVLDAMLSAFAAARSSVRPYRSTASEHTCRTAAVARPRPAARSAIR
jgi:hypothetical protein